MKRVSRDHIWTYKIVLEYHACKGCGYIIESREDYEMSNGEYVKELSCPRCNYTFIEKKPTPGPPTKY